MDRHDIGHRFCNQDFGKDGHLKCGNISVEGHNYYSYGTVFAQWVDLEKKVCLVYEGGTSISSSKHKIHSSYFPGDVTVFPYDDGYFSRSSWYHGCRLLYWSGDKFEWSDRRKLLDYWIDRQLWQFKAIVEGKTRDLERVSFVFWGYVEKLCLLYKDTSVNKWLQSLDSFPEKYKGEVKIMVKMLMKGERDVKTITDAIFGEGTYQRYIDYCKRFDKADKKKAQMEWLCNRLGIDSPYDGFSRHRSLNEGKLTAKEIRKLTAKQRNEIHFASIAYDEWKKNESVRNELKKKRKRNAYKWIVGEKPIRESKWNDSYKDLKRCRNMFTGEEYDLTPAHKYGHYEYFTPHSVKFEYDQFRKSDDKDKWIRDFYDLCKLTENNIKAQDTLERINAHFSQGKYSWIKLWVDDDFLVQNTTPDEYAVCKDFITRQQKYYADQAARERAEAIRRQREEEEKKREKELQEKLKQEEIERVFSNGIDGGIEGPRNLWRMHYMDCRKAIQKWRDYGWLGEDSEFYNGGNVLMRFNMDKTIVETSMNIRLDIETCKKMWRIIKIWHENPSKFRETKIDTHYSGTYTITSYENDILTAGCHHIAYAEMERMYNEILENEKAA